MKPLLLSLPPVILALLLVTSLLTFLGAAPAAQQFTGMITDSMCADANHSSMRMGPTDAECTVACILEHGAEYVLFDGAHAYTLSDQKTPEKFAAKKVTVLGTLDAKTHKIQVETITLAK